MKRRSTMRSGVRPARSAAALALVLLLAGCLYGFTGGGLPPHVRTVYVEPFENETTEFGSFVTDVQLALQDELPRRLGVRLASEDGAHAVVRGKLVNYDEAAQNVRASQAGRVEVLRREVRITFQAEIYDMVEDRVLWRGTSVSAVGEYNPDAGESVEEARREAIEEMVRKVVEGAQSQW